MNTPTPAQIEKYIEAADLELGPECSDSWVEWCRQALREALARAGGLPGTGGGGGTIQLIHPSWTSGTVRVPPAD